MEKQSRKSLLKNAAKAAAVVTGGVMMTGQGSAQGAAGTRKTAYPLNAPKPAPGAPRANFSKAVRHGDMLYLSSVDA
jgi:hypothetical protein